MYWQSIIKTGLVLLAVTGNIFFLACSQRRVNLSPNPVEIKPGEMETVTATVTVDGDPAANVMVAFATGDQNVATVSPASANTDADGQAQGTVKGESPGNTPLTATVEGASASAAVNVGDQPPCDTHQVVMDNFALGPDTLTIKGCDTVTWSHEQGVVPHTVTSGNVDDGDAGMLFDSRAGNQNARMREPDTFSHTFQDAGTFPYHCVVHGGGSMTGTITVNPNQ